MCFKRINLKDKPTPAYDLYMGRENKWQNLPGSKWGNPFWMKNEGMRAEVLEKYRQHILSRPDLIAALPELVGLTLACWCPAHKKCHIDVLSELYQQFYGKEEPQNKS